MAGDGRAERIAGFDSLPREMALRVMGLLGLEDLRVCVQVGR